MRPSVPEDVPVVNDAVLFPADPAVAVAAEEDVHLGASEIVVGDGRLSSQPTDAEYLANGWPEFIWNAEPTRIFSEA